jgi:hypothetical protein
MIDRMTVVKINAITVRSPAFSHGHRAGAEPGGPAPAPVGVSSELWSYEVAGGSAGECAP